MSSILVIESHELEEKFRERLAQYRTQIRREVVSEVKESEIYSLAESLASKQHEKCNEEIRKRDRTILLLRDRLQRAEMPIDQKQEPEGFSIAEIL